MNTKAYNKSMKAPDLNGFGCFGQQQGCATTRSDPAHVLYGVGGGQR